LVMRGRGGEEPVEEVGGGGRVLGGKSGGSEA